ncbi:hypothetical protein HI914_02481 [Erysiphe necator]|nr:hypothetical protein HI914_02481 [Erysiphe necator]
MKLSYSAVGILVALVQLGVNSIAFSGYNCDGVFINDDYLRGLNKEIARERMDRSMQSRQKFSNVQKGSPSEKPYLLWPIAPTSKDYHKAPQGTIKAVISGPYNNPQAVSVVKMSGNHAIPCKVTKFQADVNPFL